MSSIVALSIDVLKVHPENQEYFDEISGEDYEQFKNSIQEEGIIHEIVVAPDMTILSGHQRYKAAKELGWTTIKAKIREDIKSEDEKLRILLAANFGRKKNSPEKERRVAVKYVELCGNTNGGDRKSDRQIGSLKYEEIAKELGISERDLHRWLRIERNLTDDMKKMLDAGKIPQTFAADVIAGMSEEEQLSLISSLDVTKKYTAKEMKSLVAQVKKQETEIRQKDNRIKELESEVNKPAAAATSTREKFEKTRADRLQSENDDLRRKLSESNNRVTLPADYEQLKKNAESMKTKMAEKQAELEKAQKERDRLRAEAEEMRRTLYPQDSEFKRTNEMFDFVEVGIEFANQCALVRLKDSFWRINEEEHLARAFDRMCQNVMDSVIELQKARKTEVIDLDQMVC